MYGMMTASTPDAAGFIRYPPSLSLTMYGLLKPNQLREKIKNENSAVNAKLNDFQQMFQQHATGLIGMDTSLIPPGHPLFSRLHSTTTLKAENDKLRKENLELKKQLEKTTKGNKENL